LREAGEGRVDGNGVIERVAMLRLWWPISRHAVQAAGSASAAGREVDSAVGPDLDIGAIQGLAGDELLGLRFVRGPIAGQGDGENAPDRPVAEQEVVVVLRRELAGLVEGHARGAAAAKLERGRQAVVVI